MSSFDKLRMTRAEERKSGRTQGDRNGRAPFDRLRTGLSVVSLSVVSLSNHDNYRRIIILSSEKAGLLRSARNDKAPIAILGNKKAFAFFIFL